MFYVRTVDWLVCVVFEHTLVLADGASTGMCGEKKKDRPSACLACIVLWLAWVG